MPDLNNVRLSQDSKDNLIEKSKELFFTYLAMNKLSKLANDNPAELTASLLNLGGTLDASGEYIDFGPQADATSVEVKDLVLYTNEDYLKILAGTRWKISQQDGKYKFSTTIDNQQGKSYSIGGADKIDLYELHIHNLGKTIKHLSSDESDENMLISMTTGSGKTFTQSLMVMAQYLSGIHGVFVLPNDVLLKQFKSDIQTLMPQEMYEDMITKDPATQEEAIKLGTVEQLIENPIEFQKIQAFDSSNTMIFLDEAHKLDSQENIFLRAKALAGKFVNTYLTATPTLSLYDLAKGLNDKRSLVTVASMTNAEKIKGNYAREAIAHAQTTQTKNQMDRASRKMGFFDKDRVKRFIASLVDPIPATNLAYAFGKSYLYNININSKVDLAQQTPIAAAPEVLASKQLRNILRWKLQPSATQGKSLILTDNFEDIVNLDLLTQNLTPVKYELFLLKDLPPNTEPAKGKIYLEKVGDKIKYVILNPENRETLKILKDCPVGLLEKAELTAEDLETHQGELYTKLFGGIPSAQMDVLKYQDEQEHAPNFLQSEFYFNKNLHSMGDVYSTLQLDDNGATPDTRSFQNYQKHLNESYKASLTDEIQKLAKDANIEMNELANEEMVEIVNDIMISTEYAPITNSMHGIIDLALSIIASDALTTEVNSKNLGDITRHFGRNYLETNRFKDSNGFALLLQNKAQAIKLDSPEDIQKIVALLEYRKNAEGVAGNEAGITTQQAQALAVIIEGIIQDLKKMGPSRRGKLVDNWYASKQSISLLGKDIKNNLFDFAKNNYKLYAFNEVDDNEGIESGKVFTSFAQATKSSDDGNHKFKSRKKRTVEALNPYYEEASFIPQDNGDPQMNLEIATNLFRAGISSVFATNMLVAGFNDVNLQTVAILGHSENSMLLSPANFIQGAGRNRSLDEFQVPNLHVVTPSGVKMHFGVAQLNKEDYTKEYLEASKKYKQQLIKHAGLKLGENVIEWIKQNSDSQHNITDEDLVNKISELAWDTLEEINKVNHFQFALSVRDFEKVISGAISHIYKIDSKLKQGAQLDLSTRIAGFLVFTKAKIMHDHYFMPKLKKGLDIKLAELKSLAEPKDGFPKAKNIDAFKAFKIHHKIITKLSLPDAMIHFSNIQLTHKTIVEEMQNFASKTKIDLEEPEVFFAKEKELMYELLNSPLALLSDENQEILKSNPTLAATYQGLISLSILKNENSFMQKTPEALLNKLQDNETPWNKKRDFARHMKNVVLMLNQHGANINVNTKNEQLVKNALSEMAQDPNVILYCALNHEQITPDSVRVKTLIESKLKKRALKLINPLIQDASYKRAAQYMLKSFDAKEMQILLEKTPAEVKLFREFISDLQKGKAYSMSDAFISKYFPGNSLDDNASSPIFLECFHKMIGKIDQSFAYSYGVTSQASTKIRSEPDFVKGLLTPDHQLAGEYQGAMPFILNKLKEILPTINKLEYFKSKNEMALAQKAAKGFFSNLTKSSLKWSNRSLLKKEAAKMKGTIYEEFKKSKNTNANAAYRQEIIQGTQKNDARVVRMRKKPKP